jgi:hypothetical protein
MLATRESTAATVPGGHPGVIARLVDVVVDPRAAFRSIAIRPAWIGALFVVAAMRFASMFAFYRPDDTPAKLVAGVVFQLATIVPVMLVSGALLWFASRLWAIRLRWSVALSIVTHVYAAHTIATILVASVAGAVLPASAEVDLNSPPFTAVSALVDVSSFPFLERLLGELDVRSAYAGGLVALGVAAADPVASRIRIAGVVASCVAVRVAGVAWAALQ